MTNTLDQLEALLADWENSWAAEGDIHSYYQVKLEEAAVNALPDLLAAARALEKARAFVAGVDLHGGAAEPADQWRYSLLPAIDAALARLGAKGES